MTTPQERENRSNDLPFVIPLTANAIRDIQFAQQEAKRLNSHFVETEHLLLGLIRDPLIQDTFSKLNIDSDNVYPLVEQVAANRNRQFPGETDFSLGFKKVIKFATEEANGFSQKEVTQVDLLIGIVREQYGIGAKVLKSLGLTKNMLSDFKNAYISLKEQKIKDSSPATPITDALELIRGDPNICPQMKVRLMQEYWDAL